MSNQTPAEGLRQQLLTLKDENGQFVISSMIAAEPMKLHALIEFVTAYAATVEREADRKARIDEWKRLDVGVDISKKYVANRLAALQGPIQGDAPDRSEPQTP